MIRRLKRLFISLLRLPYSRGFGIQSPFAYAFVRYVVNEHYPYYDYDKLALDCPVVDKNVLKLCRLYFRISNYAQASEWITFEPETEVYALYVQAGCHHTCVVRTLNDTKTVAVARVSLTGNFKPFVESILSKVGSESILIVEGIKKDKESCLYWNQLISDPRTGVSFDLYDCGIIFFDHEKFKQNYLINF
jgi:hypothetical protein